MDIVGRETELAFLGARLREVQDEPRAVIVRGESGLGKSTLLASFVDEAAGTGALVLPGACLDLEGEWPFQPLRSGVDRWCRRHLDPAGRTNGTGDARIASLMTSVRETLTPGAGANVALPAVYDVMATLASHRRVVWCLDDLQWVDSATRGLLVALMAAPPPCPILIVAAATSTDLAAGDTATRTLRRTLAELEASPRAQRLTLTPLERTEAIVLAERLGWTGDPAQTEQLCARAQGNPFHLTELVRHGPPGPDDAAGAEDGRVAMPETLRQRLVERWSCQDPLAGEAVAAVAVSPTPVPHEILVGVLAAPERDVIAALRHAVDTGLLRSGDDGYVVAHRLLAEAVASDLLAGQRRSLHRRLAEQYGMNVNRSDGTPGVDHRATRAHHWSRAGQPERALPDLLEAATEADRSRPATTAWGLWQAVLQTAGALSAEQVPVRLRWDAAAAAHRAGDSTAAVRLTDDLTGPRTPGALMVQRARYLAAVGRLVPALDALDAVQHSESQGPVRDAAVALSAELAVRQGSFRTARDRAAVLVEASANEPATSPDGNVLRAGVVLGFSEAYLGNPVIGRHWLQRSLHQAETSGDVELAALAYRHLSELLAGPLNDLEEGVRIARVGANRLTELSGPGPAVASLVASGAGGLFRLGRWDEAEQWVSDELANGHVGHALADLLLARTRIVMALGQLDQADRDIECAAILLADDPGEQQQLPLDTLRAGSALWRGRVDEAREAVRVGLGKVRAGYEDQWRLAPLIWHGLRAEGDAASRGLPVDLVWARELQERLEQAERSCAGNVQATVAGYRLLCTAEIGRVHRTPDAAAWERAAEHWYARTHPYPATYARLHQAAALFAVRSRHHDATVALRAAHQQAVRMGAGPLTRQTEALARRARVRLGDDPVPVGGDEPGSSPLQEAGLSKREIEVLALVAQGRTNREIGQSLFISERTVGVHVSRILAKLQVRSRVQASAWYVQLGATPSPASVDQ